MIGSLLKQLKDRRLTLGLKQNDMVMRIGMSRQQYQQLESKGNPRLDTLELVAKGLKGELMLIPKEKISAVLAVLTEAEGYLQVTNSAPELPNDPWQGVFEDDS